MRFGAGPLTPPYKTCGHQQCLNGSVRAKRKLEAKYFPLLNPMLASVSISLHKKLQKYRMLKMNENHVLLYE